MASARPILAALCLALARLSPEAPHVRTDARLPIYSNPTPSPASAARYCAALLPSVQALVKVPLTVGSADDNTTDQIHTGEPGYASCVFTHDAYRLTIILSQDPSKDFATNDKGYKPLSGFGDKARVLDGSLKWVDVMYGKTFCEAIVSLDPSQLTEADWTYAAGKMCNAATAKR
jgi:hypothetical protein